MIPDPLGSVGDEPPARGLDSTLAEGSAAVADFTRAACAPVFHGVVVGGNGRGKRLGFPTANLAIEAEGQIPEDGVYSCLVSFPPLAAELGATMSIGRNPTFDDVAERRVEVYIHDFAGDLYGCTVLVRVVGLLRPTLRFDTVAELIERTEQDISASRALLGGVRLPGSN